MNYACLFCGKGEVVFLEFVVYDSKTGERCRDIVGGVCSECATTLENRAFEHFFRNGDDLVTHRIDTKQMVGAMVNRFATLRSLFVKQFPHSFCDGQGYRFIPFTHPLGLEMWRVRQKEEDGQKMRLNPVPLPEIIRATAKEHDEIVRQAIADEMKKAPRD